jgi:SNF2 family DNA or RNA helicase
LFGQIYILDGGAALGAYITHYRSQFFKHPDYIHPCSGMAMEDTYKWVPKEGMEDVIYEKIRPMVLRMDAADYLELPARIDNVVYVDLPDKARKVYKELERDFITMLANGEALIAPSVAAVGTKLRQIANGGVYRNVENRAKARTHAEEWIGMHDAKLDALEEIVESRIGKPVLVAYEFEHDATRLRKKFPQAVFIADFKGKHIEEVVERWNAGEIMMLCAHPASAGHGLNLQKEKDTVVWFGLTWNLEHFEQFNARVLRQGNTSSHVFIHHIVARRTVDEAVMKALLAKAKAQNDLLDALRDYAKETREEGTVHV